jgi:hypothetical protein
VSISRKMVIYTTNGYYTALKTEILPFGTTTETDIENIVQDKISQTQKEKHQIISIICGK